MPPQTDHLYVVDMRHVLRGIVPLPVLLVSELRVRLARQGLLVFPVLAAAVAARAAR